jgi:hypothetical protein
MARCEVKMASLLGLCRAVFWRTPGDAASSGRAVGLYRSLWHHALPNLRPHPAHAVRPRPRKTVIMKEYAGCRLSASIPVLTGNPTSRI